MNNINIDDSRDSVDLDIENLEDISLENDETVDEEDLDSLLKRGKSELVEFETFLISKDYFTRVKDFGDSIQGYWKLGVYGNLIQMNFMKWWYYEMITNPSNVIPIEKIDSDSKVYLNYKNYASANKKKIPFGIGRTLKVDRIQFDSSNFIFVNKPSKHQLIEFFVKPERSNSWLESWFSILKTKLKSIGFNSDNLTWFHKKDAVDISSDNYFYEKYDIVYEFPFGKEVIGFINNKTDHDFKNEENKQILETLKYEDSEDSYFPHIIRVSIDIEKTILAILWERFRKNGFYDVINRSVVLSPKLAPIKAVILPEDSSSDECIESARSMYKRISEKNNISFETKSCISFRIRHYRELGVPYFIFVNDSYLKNGKVDLFDAYNEGWLNLNEDEIILYFDKNSISLKA
ncbi:MAG: hypothetical protein CR982_01185 [Candidatus Cloacimonadota bacterium]|nr:MAG: hypothetical protein CR982_01185 [Candidatus Cloacimonadota bacterium]PIE81258.1 MAG: hypothetical protein CSA15_00965 [Candidatus Delongbacteria bacterium]